MPVPLLNTVRLLGAACCIFPAYVLLVFFFGNNWMPLSEKTSVLLADYFLAGGTICLFAGSIVWIYVLLRRMKISRLAFFFFLFCFAVWVYLLYLDPYRIISNALG